MPGSAKHFTSLHHNDAIIGFSQHPYKKGADYLFCINEETADHLPKITQFVQVVNGILAKPISI